MCLSQGRGSLWNLPLKVSLYHCLFLSSSGDWTHGLVDAQVFYYWATLPTHKYKNECNFKNNFFCLWHVVSITNYVSTCCMSTWIYHSQGSPVTRAWSKCTSIHGLQVSQFFIRNACYQIKSMEKFWLVAPEFIWTIWQIQWAKHGGGTDYIGQTYFWESNCSFF